MRTQQQGRHVLPVGMVSTCIGCGCDDQHACPLGCWWLRVDREAGRGVCSECPQHLERFGRLRKPRAAKATA